MPRIEVIELGPEHKKEGEGDMCTDGRHCTEYHGTGGVHISAARTTGREYAGCCHDERMGSEYDKGGQRSMVRQVVSRPDGMDH